MWWQPDQRTESDSEMKLFVNIVSYQLIWFLCILGGNKGALISLSLLAIHLIISNKRRADLRMMCFLLFLGLTVDGTLHQVGLFSFTTSGFPIPFWLMVIWLGLAITPHHSLAWMQDRPLLSAVFGALGGPAAYWAGVRMGAASFNWPLLYSLAFLAVLWGVLWTLVMRFSLTSQADQKNACARLSK